MSAYFLDSSALVKRYRTEPGSVWIKRLLEPGAGHTITICEITLSEVAAALAAAHRAPGGISRIERDEAVNLFLAHCHTRYGLLGIVRSTIRLAVTLTQSYRLRGCDAVQLATALSANRDLRTAGAPPMIFVAADEDLLAAARGEGLATEDPRLYA
jgi:predicted nucleic acid-binding protein